MKMIKQAKIAEIIKELQEYFDYCVEMSDNPQLKGEAHAFKIALTRLKALLKEDDHE